MQKTAGKPDATNTQTHERINLISGAYTLPFVDTLNAVTNEDINTHMMIITLLTRLANKSDDETAAEVLRVFYSIIGLTFPEIITKICDDSHLRGIFIREFVSDLKDIILHF